MSDQLNPYPGNLKQHKVDKEEQRNLLCEMMADDAKNGLYDTAKLEPLLSHEEAKELFIQTGGGGDMDGVLNILDHYEAARAKDAELIQRLVDAGNAMRRWIEYAAPAYCDEQDRHNAGRATEQWAAAAGFTPTNS